MRGFLLGNVGFMSLAAELTCAHAICAFSWSSKKISSAALIFNLTYCIKTTFYDGSVVLKRHTAGWVLNRFFFESCGKTYDFLRTTIYERWKGDDPFQASILENTVCRVSWTTLFPRFGV